MRRIWGASPGGAGSPVQAAAGGSGRQAVTVRAVVRDVVSVVAPDELPLVDAMKDVDDDRAVRLLTGDRRRTREPLGFGVDEAVALITPIVWLALHEALRHGVQTAVDSATQRLRRGVRRLFRRPSAAPLTVAALTREQFTAVHLRVRERAADMGLDDERANALADQVVARLVLELPTDAPPSDED